MTRRWMAFMVASLFIFSAGIFVSCSTESEAKVTEIKLPTMQCMMCKENIETALKDVDGVKAVEVDSKKKLARVTFLPAKINLEQVEITITKAGYDANGRKADPKAYAKLGGCCQVPDAK